MCQTQGSPGCLELLLQVWRTEVVHIQLSRKRDLCRTWDGTAGRKETGNSRQRTQT